MQNSRHGVYLERATAALMWRKTLAEVCLDSRLSLSISLIICLSMAFTAEAGMVSFIDNPHSKCPQGWAEVIDAKGRLILGTTDPALVGKTQGTPMQDQTPPLHQHDFTIGVQLKFEPVVALSGLNYSLTGANTEYTASGTAAASDGNLPYMQLLVCEQQSGLPAEQAMPKEMVAFYNDVDCPQQWELYEKLNRRFAVPLPADAKGGDFNALIDLWPDAGLNHSHAIKVVDDTSTDQDESVKISIAAQSVVLLKSFWPFTQNKSWGNHTVHDRRYNSSAGNTIAPYINFLACRKTAGRNRSSQLPAGMLGFVTAEHCPDKWTQKPESMGRFLVGLPQGQFAYSGVSFGSSPLKTREVRQHSHDLETSINLPGLGIAGANGCCAHGYARAGDYSMRGKTVLSAITLPYVQIRHCIIPQRASAGEQGGRIKQ